MGVPPGFLYCRTLCYCFVAVDICRQFPFDFWLPDTVMDQGLDLGWQSFVNWTNHSAGFVPKNKVFRLTRQSSSFYNPMPFEWKIEKTINKLTSVEFTDCALFGYSFSLSPVHRVQVYKLYVKPDHSKIRNCIQDHPLPWKMACWWCKIVWAGWFTSSFLHMKEAGFLVEGFRIEQPRRIRLWRRTSSTHSNKANYPRERSPKGDHWPRIWL